jgi:hypothetical protein
MEGGICLPLALWPLPLSFYPENSDFPVILPGCLPKFSFEARSAFTRVTTCSLTATLAWTLHLELKSSFHLCGFQGYYRPDQPSCRADISVCWVRTPFLCAQNRNYLQLPGISPKNVLHLKSCKFGKNFRGFSKKF